MGGGKALSREQPPFLLFDDMRADDPAPPRLYLNPHRVIETRDPAAVLSSLDAVRDGVASGSHAAGFLSYEAGYALEQRLYPLARRSAPTDPPLLWFGLFDGVEVPNAADGRDLVCMSGTSAKPRLSFADYRRQCQHVIDNIHAGDIYQANLTFPCDVRVDGSPHDLYASVRAQAGASYGCYVDTGLHDILCFSPELFFRLDNRHLTAKPMKGTAVRHVDRQADYDVARALARDPKQCAENLMIVDLLRNDFSRISRPGSVTVSQLFGVETYPTVHQMVSTVEADLQPGLTAFDVLRAIFPCGSITGAPKLRAMEIIRELEGHDRGVYTGSIGWIEPGGDALFNVAIRTMTLRKGTSVAQLGLGSGVTAGSDIADEWTECLDKGRFLTPSDPVTAH